jgi:multiple sugar transport system permease protein
MLTTRQRLLLLTPLAMVLVPFLFWPAGFGLVASFTNYGPLQNSPRWVGFANYAAILGNQQFRAAALNSAAYTLVTVSAELAIGLALAHLLREPFLGRGAVQVALLLPWLVSPIANGVMWHFLFDQRTGLYSYLPALLGGAPLPSPLGLSRLAMPVLMAVDVWRMAPLATFLLVPGLAAIPLERWEQARLDGLSLLERLRHVILPTLGPLLATVGLLLIGDSLGAFDTVLILTGGGPGSQTLTPGLFSYQQAFQVNNWPAGATSAWLIMAAMALIGVVYVLALQRREVARRDT